MKKITVIVNKNWETEPVLNALTNPKLRPAELPFPDVINTPRDGNNRMNEPRAIITFRQKGEESMQVLIRCIEDIMSPTANTSNSLEKYKVLPAVIAADAADLIISVSTANHPDTTASHNGCVVIGSNFFIHDGNPDSRKDPEHNLIHPAVGTFMPSNVSPGIFSLIGTLNERLIVKGKSKLIPPPNYPAVTLACDGSDDYASVGSINITDYSSYDTIDAQALAEFYETAPANCTAQSIETTHGVVKICATDEPILFLSPITDRLNHFNDDVTDSQNYIAAFNGGLVLGELLCLLYGHLV